MEEDYQGDWFDIQRTPSLVSEEQLTLVLSHHWSLFFLLVHGRGSALKTVAFPSWEARHQSEWARSRPKSYYNYQM